MALGAGDIKILSVTVLSACLEGLSSLSFATSSLCRPLQKLSISVEFAHNFASGSSKNNSALPRIIGSNKYILKRAIHAGLEQIIRLKFIFTTAYFMT